MTTTLTPGTSIDSAESAIITITLFDPDAEFLTANSVTFLTLTLMDQYGNVINGRDDQDVLGVNGGSITITGLVRIILDPADNPFVDEFSPSETHSLELSWGWNDKDGAPMTGSQKGTIQISRSLE
jgi:hypothetical protein